MKRFSKKLAALLLVAVMAVSLFPSSVFAADEAGNNDPAVVEQTGGLVEDETDAAETTAAEETTAEEKTSDETTAEKTATPETTAEETSPAEEATAPEVTTAAPTETSAAEPTVPETPVAPAENSITAQPQDAIVAPYGKAVFEVQTIGKVSSYKWQYSTNNGWSWWNYGSKKSSITVTGSKSGWSYNNGNMYRCIVTFKDGTKVTSDAATLYVASAQSFKNSAKKADNADVSVKAPAGTFPDETSMEVTDVVAEDYVEAISQELGSVTASDITAVDISFKYGGEEIEPANDNKVTVTITSDAIKADSKIVHIDDFGNAKEVEIVSIKDGEVVFMSDAFSVYAVVGENEESETPYRTTYEFYNADGTNYIFNDAAGNPQHTQILKDGEVLEDVGIPTAGASQNAKFVGWYVWNEDGTLGDKVEVGETKTVTANTTIRLKAKLQGIVNVFFVTAVMKDDQGQDVARSIITTKQVEYTVGQTAPITVTVSDVTTEAPTNEQAVVGWNRNETDANNGIAEGTDGVVTLYTDTTGTIIDVMMFPAIHDAAWLYFDENDGGTGGGASYTPPEFVIPGGKPTRPADPHRTGYTFGGWYKDSACTQEFSFDEPLTQTTTVYAKWDGAQTSYTIIVKVQSTSDSAKITSTSNLAHADKTYDFWKAYTINNVQTGGTATVTNTYKQLANQIDSNGHIKYETCDPDTTIAADGSTVLYAYYERDVMTIHWKRAQNQADFEVWYGLYDASFEESGKTWIEPRSGRRWRTSSALLTFKDAFNGFDNNSTSLTIYEVDNTDSSYDIYFYTENVDGSWKLDHQFDFNANSFTFTEKYDAFSLYQYSRNGSTWNTARVGNSVNRNGQNLYIRYSRNSYDIEYHNGTQGAEGTVVRTDSLLYEAPLASHVNPTVEYPIAADRNHYDFIGWFADSGWKTMVTFTELDEETKANYREWYGVAEFVTISKMPSHNFPLYAGYALKGWDCALDPNGGEFTNPSQAGVFWLRYGEKFSSDLKTNVKRDGYIFQGWMVASVEGNLNVVTRNNLRFVGDDSNWTMSDNPWEFSTGIEGPTYLMAKWFYASAMNVVYDANGGSNPPTDEGAYSDGATTVAFRASVPPTNKFFIGWDIVGTETEEHLQPGDTFTVSSDYAVNGVVTLKAIYNDYGPEEEVPVTHIDWYANNTQKGTDGTLLHVSEEDIQLNKDVPIRPETTFANGGYQFLGWAKLHTEGGALYDHNDVAVSAAAEGSNMDYALTADNLYLKYENGKFWVMTNGAWAETSKVAADEKLPYDDLYAVWGGEFYVYHSGVAGGAIETIPVKPTYDLTGNLTSATLYGGYYLKDGFTAPAEVDGKIPAYDGDNWTWTKAETVSGKAIEPQFGVTYYIKEVPADKFLQPYTHYTYNKADNSIADMWMISDIDDNNYTETGFVITKDNVAKVCTSLTVKNAVGGASVKLTPQKVFKAKGVTANDFLTYLAVIGGNVTGEKIIDGSKIVMYWVTPDGLRVTGITERTLTGIDNKSNLEKSDASVDSTITVSE